MDKKKGIVAYLFLLPFLSGMFIFYIIPFAMSIYYSFTKGIGDVEFVGFENYLDLFNNDAFRLASKNTGVFIGISVPLIMIISLGISMIINDKLKGISFFRIVFTLPLVIPVVSIVLFWKIIFNENGVLNTVLSTFNVEGINWLKSGYSIFILSVLYLWKNCAYNIILFLVGLNNIPSVYYEASRVDGCGNFKRFTKITLPLLLPTTVLVFIVSIINCFKVYKEAYLLAGEYPSTSMYMLQHFMNNNFENLNYQRLCTASI